MKKLSKIVSFFSSLALSAAMVVPLAACSLFESEEVKTFKSSAVTVERNYDYIKWDKLDYATSYEVYGSDGLIEETSSTMYTFGSEISSDLSLYVIAKSSSLACSSSQSNVVTVYKNTNFTSSEILDLSSSTGSNTVSSSVRKIEIKDFTGTKSIVIGDRTTDIVIEISNSTLEGGLDLSTPEGSENVFMVTLIVDGDVSVTGTDGITSTVTFDAESGQNGIDGGDGQNALTVSGTLVVKGEGNLTVTGGNGGNGSDGADVNGAWSTACPGKGSDGGDGGNGIACETLIVDMSSDSTLTATGGTGGAKGSPGKNGSLITGPTCSLVWSTTYDIGQKGSDGAGITGSVSSLSGKVIY